MDYQSLARTIAQEEGVDPDLFLKLIQAESSFNPQARSPVGAIGLAQLMPATAAELGVDPNDPEQNLRGGARYLKQQMDTFGTPELALAAYNAGPGNVRKYGGVPPFEETQNYLAKILGTGGGSAAPQGAPTAPPMQEGYQTAPPVEQGDFARGYQPQQQINPFSFYNPQEIARKFRLG